jgi:hypothetical protein
MEVLISIFILAVGLLGVAALLPVGSSEALEAIKTDVAYEVGAAALQEVHMRKILYPFHFEKTLDSLWYEVEVKDNQASLVRMDIDKEDINSGYLIDPIGLANAKQAKKLSEWKYFPKGFSFINIKRITLKTVQDPKDAWELFGTPDGNYSWMVLLGPTLTPKVSGNSAFWRGVCSVIVFYKRNLDLVGEKVVPIESSYFTEIGGEEGGGEIILNSSDPQLGNQLKERRWILLFSNTGSSWWAQWYQVVAACKPTPTSNWYVTVLGKSWSAPHFPPQDPPQYAPQYALIMEGVVAVVSEIVEVDWKGGGGILLRW